MAKNGVVISDEVIAKIVHTAALEVDGVADVVPRPADLRGMFRNRSSQAVHVSVSDNSISVDMFLKLKMGVKVISVCDEVQQKVKETVQNMTGKVMSKVNVNVVDIEMETEKKQN